MTFKKMKIAKKIKDFSFFISTKETKRTKILCKHPFRKVLKK